jgi:hypothetical protein
MSTVPPENKVQFKHDVITRFVSVRCAKSFGVMVRVVVINATFNNMSVFYQIFAKLVGAPLLNEMKREEPEAYLDIFREFEAVKRIVYTEKNDKVKMTIPRGTLDQMCKKHSGHYVVGFMSE